MHDVMMSDDDRTLLDLFASVKKAYHLRMVHYFERIGLPYGQPPILAALRCRDGQTQTELCHAVKLTPASMTASMQRMEASGLIRREQDPNDSRTLRVHLTNKAVALLEETQDQTDAFRHQILDGFTDTEKILLKRFLLQIEENILKTADEPMQNHSHAK